MYINHKQSNWSEWLATAEFVFNNKVYTAMKSSPFKVNYRKPRMGFEIRKREVCKSRGVCKGNKEGI